MFRWTIGLVLLGLVVGCGEPARISLQATPESGSVPAPSSLTSLPTAALTLEQQIPTARAIYDELLTATAAAQPAPTFLTVREAFNHAALRERARRWAADAMLVDAQIGYLNEPIDLSEFAANDGTSRNWTITFASSAQSSLHVYVVRDGVLLNDYGDEKSYRDMFVGVPPRDIPLENPQILDSDQARVVFLRRFDDSWETLSQFQIFRLSSVPSTQDDTASAPYGYWMVQDRVNNRSRIDSQTGQTIYTSFDEDVADVVAPTKSVVPTAAPLLIGPTQVVLVEIDLQEAFFSQNQNIKDIQGQVRFAGLYATNGTTWWKYGEDSWVAVFPTDRLSLSRAGVPGVLINN